MAAPIEDERRLGAQAALTDPNLAPWSSGGYWPGLPVRRARLDVSLAGTAVRMEVRSRAAARNRNPGQNQPVGRVASSAGLQTCRRADVQTCRRADVQTFRRSDVHQARGRSFGGVAATICATIRRSSLHTLLERMCRQPGRGHPCERRGLCQLDGTPGYLRRSPLAVGRR